MRWRCWGSPAPASAPFAAVLTCGAGPPQVRPPPVGARRAREILFLNEGIPAAKAEQWGLVNWVVSRGALDAKVDEVVEKLKAKFPETTRYTKQQLNFWRDLS